MNTTHTGTIEQVSVNPQGGVPKHAVAHAQITTQGVSGDKQRNRTLHGGPERAVCLYSAEHIDALRQEGHPIAAGSTGENLTIRGLDWGALVPGVRLAIGETVVLEMSSYTVPCKTIAGSFVDGKSARIGQKLHPGWSRLYARVLHEGAVQPGDTVRLL